MATDGDACAVVTVDQEQLGASFAATEQQPARSMHWLGLPTTVWIGVAYWWYFAGLSCLLTYLALYFKERLGFSGIEIGVLTTISPIAVAICAPAWGLIADGFGAHRLVLRCGLLAIAILGLLLTQTTNFWLMLLLVGGIGMFGAPIPSMLDSYGVTIGEQQRLSYGQLRLWGSLGYSVATWLIGWWMGSNLTSVFLIAYAIAALLALGATFGLPALTGRANGTARHGLGVVLKQPAMRVLLLTAFLATSSTGMVFNFFGIYVTALDGSLGLLGAATALAALCELPVLLFGAYLLNRFGSQRVLILAVALYTVRFAGYTLVPSAAWIIPLQLSHGLTFGAFLMASVTLAYHLVGTEYAATAQGLLSAVSYGFGAIVGSLAGGALLDSIGIIGLYRVATGLMLLALVVLLLGLRSVRDQPSA